MFLFLVFPSFIFTSRVRVYSVTVSSRAPRRPSSVQLVSFARFEAAEAAVPGRVTRGTHTPARQPLVTTRRGCSGPDVFRSASFNELFLCFVFFLCKVYCRGAGNQLSLFLLPVSVPRLLGCRSGNNTNDNCEMNNYNKKSC